MSFVESCREGKPSRNNSRKCFSWGYFSWPDWHTQLGWLFHVFASPAWARDEEMWLISDIMNTKCNDKPNGEQSKKDVVIIVFIRALHNCQAQVQVQDSKISKCQRVKDSRKLKRNWTDFILQALATTPNLNLWIVLKYWISFVSEYFTNSLSLIELDSEADLAHFDSGFVSWQKVLPGPGSDTKCISVSWYCYSITTTKKEAAAQNLIIIQFYLGFCIQ